VRATQNRITSFPWVGWLPPWRLQPISGGGRDAVVMVLAVARRVCVPFPPLHSIVGGFLRKLLLAFGEELRAAMQIWCSLKCLSGMLFAFPVVGV